MTPSSSDSVPRSSGYFTIACHGQAELFVKWDGPLKVQCAVCGADVVPDPFFRITSADSYPPNVIRETSPHEPSKK